MYETQHQLVLIDDVFRPKDVNLENGDLDEFEKELEAFKRYVNWWWSSADWLKHSENRKSSCCFKLSDIFSLSSSFHDTLTWTFLTNLLSHKSPVLLLSVWTCNFCSSLITWTQAVFLQFVLLFSFFSQKCFSFSFQFLSPLNSHIKFLSSSHSLYHKKNL